MTGCARWKCALPIAMTVLAIGTMAVRARAVRASGPTGAKDRNRPLPPRALLRIGTDDLRIRSSFITRHRVFAGRPAHRCRRSQRHRAEGQSLRRPDRPPGQAGQSAGSTARLGPVRRVLARPDEAGLGRDRRGGRAVGPEPTIGSCSARSFTDTGSAT